MGGADGQRQTGQEATSGRYDDGCRDSFREAWVLCIPWGRIYTIKPSRL